MFTIRYNRHDSSYKSYSVITYDVSHELDGEARVSMSRKLNGQDEYIEYVGNKAPFAIAYVTNLDGKTIDVIRMVDVTKAVPDGQ